MPSNLRSKEFLLEGMKHSMRFFSPERCMDPAGGYFHFYGEDGTVYDAETRVLVTQARFVFTFAVAFEHLGSESYLAAAKHGVSYLSEGPLRNQKNKGYHWVVKDGEPTSSKIFTYALAQTLLAYAAAARAGVAQGHTRVLQCHFNSIFSDKMCQKEHPPFENLKRDDHSSKNQLK